MVNVRDLGGIKHTFKLLVFPEPRLFQCANAEAKKVIHILLYKDFVFTYITFSRLGWMPSNEPRPIPKRSMSLVAPPRRPIPQSEPLIVQSNEVRVSDCLKITKKVSSFYIYLVLFYLPKLMLTHSTVDFYQNSPHFVNKTPTMFLCFKLALLAML